MMAKQEDGSYMLAYPISKDAKIPLIDAGSDMGKPHILFLTEINKTSC